MSTEMIVFEATKGLWLVLQLSLPSILSATGVGLLVSLFQALTQIQEQTLPFAFKLFSVIVALLLTARWVGVEFVSYTEGLFASIASI